MANITEDQKTLMKELLSRVWEGIRNKDATSHIEWLQKKPTALVRSTAITTQPEGWALLVQPFVESLSDDQAAMFLAAMVAVFVQAKQ